MYEALHLTEESIWIAVWLQVRYFSLIIFTPPSFPGLTFYSKFSVFLPTAVQGNRKWELQPVCVALVFQSW